MSSDDVPLIASTADGECLFPADLLPVGVVMCASRVILRCNQSFAWMFGYRPEELIGKSIAALYPSYREYVDIGERWMDAMRAYPECNDDRIMQRKDGSLIWFRAKGRCKDQNDPFSLMGCTFESLRPASSASIKLTPREREIVAAVREGLTSKEIARALGLSPRTVETYRSRLMEKLCARNSNELLAKIIDG